MQDNLNLMMEEFLPLRDVVFNTLRRAILDGSLKPGERLMEVHLANKLGVSRTPIREAMHKLELEGLVVVSPRRGAQVAKMTEKSLTDVLEVRRALDMLIAELDCERITKEQLEELKEAAKAFEEACNSCDVENMNTAAIAKTDVDFHDILMEATGNGRLKAMVKNLAEQMYRYRFVCLLDKSIHSQLIKDHRDILNAVSEGNIEKAKMAARVHIDNQEKAIKEYIRNEDE